MITSITGSLFYTRTRKLMELFPERLRSIWNVWELRVLVLLSLSLQIVLLICGNGRKYKSSIWIRVVLWCAYLMADWVATVALGVISNNLGDAVSSGKDGSLDANIELTSFWAPFLLLHLGGPDTITAYSWEDNELWLRHFVGLGVQVGIAIYIFLLGWSSSLLSIFYVVMFCAGVIKYGERTWVLRSASTEQLRDSMLTSPDPGPNYSKFMQEYTVKQWEGYVVEAAEVVEAQEQEHVIFSAVENKSIPDAVELVKAYDLLKIFKRLFVDLILGHDDGKNSQSIFRSITYDRAFKMIEIELGFIYDILYTKASLIYTPVGCCLRFATISCTCIVLVIGIIFLNRTSYSQIDLIITLLLLCIAMFLELYSLSLVLSSDWTNLWLSKHTSSSFHRAITRLQFPMKFRWSNNMFGYNLLSYCVGEKPAYCYKIQKLFCVDEIIEKQRYKILNQIPEELKSFTFSHLLNTIRDQQNVLEKFNCPELNWSFKEELDIDQVILLWHLATDLCYYKDSKFRANFDTDSCRLSKLMSDYMMYLLVICPFMLPNGIGLIRYRDTCADAKKFFEEKVAYTGNTLLQEDHNGSPCNCILRCFCKRKSRLSISSACDLLSQVNTEVLPSKVKGDSSKSVLFEACRLASQLQAIREDEKWKVISYVWVEILCAAASQCRGVNHAQQLRRGGELLSHVWLLMAHLSLTEHFRVAQGYARAKLIVK